MITQTLLCRLCNSSDLIRYGRTAAGYRRYRCKTCRRTFSDTPPSAHTDAFKKRVLAAYQERASMRGIARTFKISRNTLAAWLREKGGSCLP